MLINATKDDILKYLDFSYNLALDQSKSAYPTYTDGIKTKEDFINLSKRVFERDNEKTLLFSYEGKVEGCIQYYWITDDNLVGISSFNINKKIQIALDEFLEFVKSKFKGYEMYLGFPKKNIQAVSFLEKEGYECIGKLVNNSFFFDNYALLEENEHILKITKDNFFDFEVLHKANDNDMYWNCTRIFERIDEWNIFVYYNNGIPKGTIYFKDMGPMLEIFGIDFENDKYDENIYRMLLIKVLNEGKKLGSKYMTYFIGEEQQNILKDLGFKYVGNYVCYLIKL